MYVQRVDVSQEDSGNYTCEVRGPQSTLLGHVTHYLFVRGIVCGMLTNYTAAVDSRGLCHNGHIIGQLLALYFSLVVLFHSHIYKLFWCFIIVIGFLGWK